MQFPNISVVYFKRGRGRKKSGKRREGGRERGREEGRETETETRALAQQLALAVLPKDLGTIFCIHMAAHNCL